MWSSKRSLVLSLIVCFIVAGALLVSLFVMPSIAVIYFGGWRGFSKDIVAKVISTVLTCYYPSAVLGLLAIASLIKLLFNIKADKPFIGENVLHLRVISWCCFLVAIICIMGAYVYYSLSFIAVAAMFVGLVLRVVKNVLQAAVELKYENDLTI